MEETVGAFRVYAGQFEGSSSARQHALAEQKDQRPVFLMTTRGELGLPYRGNTSVGGQDGVMRGAYVLHDCCDETMATSTSCPVEDAGIARRQLPDVVLIASGQDVALCMKV